LCVNHNKISMYSGFYVQFCGCGFYVPVVLEPVVSTFSSVSFILAFCTSFWVTRVVCGAHLRLLAPLATRVLSQWMLHWRQVNGRYSTCRWLPTPEKFYRIGSRTSACRRGRSRNGRNSQSVCNDRLQHPTFELRLFNSDDGTGSSQRFMLRLNFLPATSFDPIKVASHHFDFAALDSLVLPPPGMLVLMDPLMAKG